MPRWLAARGGFEVAEGADLFARFAARATERLGDLIGYASTFHEANIQHLFAVAYGGVNRPRIHEMLAACARASGSERFSSLLFAPVVATEPVLLDAHRKATAAMKAGPGNFPVGLTLTMQDIQAQGDGEHAAAALDRLYGPWLDEGRNADFIGVQTYTRYLVDADGGIVPPTGVEMTGAGYEFYPQSLGATIRLAHERCGRSIFVTESGLCTDDDERRIAYLDAALAEVRAFMADGIDFHSFICWSLLDNFEWTRGYSERFGLVHVD